MKLSDIVKGLKPTERLYLTDSYATTFPGHLLRAEWDGKKNVYLVLDATLFHPKGGGQPTDTGRISNQHYAVDVKKALFAKGVIVHWGRLLRGTVGDGPVLGEIEWIKRYQYMRRHTAGHLLDHCLTTITGTPVETTESWLDAPCYVGYAGHPPSPSRVADAERLANEMITQNAPVTIAYLSYQDLLHVAPHAPNIYRLPNLEAYRVVTIEGCTPIPCAGTHLRTIREIGHVTIDKVESAGATYRMYYDVQ